MGRLTKTFAIVTGGGGGIGRAKCQLFATEGACVAVIDINMKCAEETLSQLPVIEEAKHFAVEADVTSADQVDNAFKKLKQDMGTKKGILVNCAGILRPGHIDDVTEEHFDSVIATNLKGVFLMTKAFLNSLNVDSDTVDERAVIGNLSSVSGKIGSMQYGIYSASKSGVIGLTKSTALEYLKHRVRCNVVLPGLILTQMAEQFNTDHIGKIVDLIPMNRGGQPEEVAKVCLFLASDENSYENGACLEITGGFRL